MTGSVGWGWLSAHESVHVSQTLTTILIGAYRAWIVLHIVFFPLNWTYSLPFLHFNLGWRQNNWNDCIIFTTCWFSLGDHLIHWNTTGRIHVLLWSVLSLGIESCHSFSSYDILNGWNFRCLVKFLASMRMCFPAVSFVGFPEPAGDPQGTVRAGSNVTCRSKGAFSVFLPDDRWLLCDTLFQTTGMG